MHQVAQHGGERRVGQSVGPQLQAAAGQHPGARRGGHRAELTDQPGLAGTGFPAEQHSRRPALAHAAESSLQDGHLLTPPDQDGTSCSSAHLCIQHVTRV